jgi:hypothetical protein
MIFILLGKDLEVNCGEVFQWRKRAGEGQKKGG